MKSTDLGPILAVVVAAVLAALPARAQTVAPFPMTNQLSYPGCADLKASDFEVTELFNKKGTAGEGAEYSLSKLRSQLHLQTGVYLIQVKTDRGIFRRNLSML